MTCPWCKTDFEPKKWNQRFCCQRRKDDYHNREKKNPMTVPEYYRIDLEEKATDFNITVIEALCLVMDEGLKKKEQGKSLTDKQIFGKPI